jgi:hypothetical protein
MGSNMQFLDIQFLHEQQVENMGEELGRWNNKAR